MHICLLGQNHKTAPIELREQLAFSEEKQGRLGELLAADGAVAEGVVLSTCNRMELYTVCSGEHDPRGHLGGMLEQVHGIALPRWQESLYYYRDETAIRHLFRVASGLDSMVLGEGQILAQVRDAGVAATGQQLARDVLRRVFDDAVACGKRVRTDTRVGEGAVSVAYAGVSLARKIFKDLTKETVLLVGAGETGRRVARHFQLFGVQDLRVTNRTRARGRQLADELNASLVPWERLSTQLHQASIIVTATASPDVILTVDMVRQALKRSHRRTLFLVDLSVPRDIEPGVGKIPGAFLYNVDDLEGVVLEGEDQRRLEADKAEGIVEDHVQRFLEWYQAHQLAPMLRELRGKAEKMRALELQGARGRLDPQTYAEVERITQRLLNKFLHAPTVGLKRAAVNGDRESMLRHFRALFGLDSDS